VVIVEYTNRTDVVGGIALRTISPDVTLADLVEEAEEGIPASFDGILAMSGVEPAASTRVAALMTGTSFVPNCVLFKAGRDFDSSGSSIDFVTVIVSPGA
jgi:hypothetical protein